MKQYIQKFVPYLFYLFVFLLPWQARWIWQEGELNNNYWEYGSFSLYATDLIFFILLVGSILVPKQSQVYAKKYWPLLVSFLFFVLLSIFWSDNRSISWYAAGRVIEGVLLFWVIMRLRLRMVAVALAFVGAGLVQSVLAIIQFATQQVIANKWLGMAAHQPSVLGDFVIETTHGRWLRAYGSLPHPNILAAFLVVCLLLTIGLLIWSYTKKREAIRWRLFFWLVYVVLCTALLLTFSRSAWIAFGICFVGMILVFIVQRSTEKLRLMLWLVAVLFVMITLSVFTVPEIWQTRISQPGRLEAMSSQERIDYFEESFSIIKKNWYQGVGVGAYTQASYDMEPNKEAWDYQPVHNMYILITAELGVFGGLVFAVLLFEFFRSFIRNALRTREHWPMVIGFCFMALLIAGMFDHFLWSLSFGVLFFWLILGTWARFCND